MSEQLTNMFPLQRSPDSGRPSCTQPPTPDQTQSRDRHPPPAREPAGQGQVSLSTEEEPLLPTRGLSCTQNLDFIASGDNFAGASSM